MKYLGACVPAATMLAIVFTGCDRPSGSERVSVKTEAAKAPSTQSASDPDVRAVLDAVNSGRASTTVSATPLAATSADHGRSTASFATASGTFSFAMRANNDVSWTVDHDETSERASVVVMLNKIEPMLLTPDAYDRIKVGMTYPQVAQTIGGDVADSRMSDGLTGTFAVVQGMRRIELTFKNGKVTAKAHSGLQWQPTTGPAATSTQTQQTK